jgi:hypothetical protein
MQIISTQISRRRMLGLGLVGGAGTLLIGILPVFSREEAVLDAIADRLFGRSGMPTPSEVEAGRHAWAFAMNLPADVQLQLRGLLRLIEWGALPRYGARFTALDPEQQDELLRAMSEAEATLPRMAFQGLKSICAFGTFRHPKFWAAIGYDGPTIGAAAWDDGAAP